MTHLSARLLPKPMIGALALLMAALPDLAEAGAWVLPKGRANIQIALLHQDTTERYFLDGERIPYFFEGRNRTSAFYIDGRYGITDRLEGVVQVPFFLLRFDDLSDDRRSNGLGDVRAGLRYNFIKNLPVATLDIRVKFPTGTFINDAEVVPVGEGQWDLELAGELAHSFWPRPFYVNGRAGYRFRGPNDESGLDFGDELFWLAEGGYAVSQRIGLKMVARGLHGKVGASFGIPIESLKREAVYLEPGLVIRINPSWFVEAAVPFTVSGRNWPAGPVFTLKLTAAF